MSTIINAKFLAAGLMALSLLSGCGNNKCKGALCAGDEDGGGGDIDFIEPIIKVSGTTQIHPSALVYLTDAGLPVPALAGLTLRVEEPLKVALNDADAVFGTVTLDSTGNFLVGNVDTAKVSLGVAAGVRDDQDAGSPRVVRAATVLHDVLLKNKPTVDIAGTVAFAFPTAFHDRLSATLTTATGGALPNGNLIKAGFIFGRMVDGSGNPLSGVRVVANDSVKQGRLWYLSDDYGTANQTATGANGVFVYIHTGIGGADTFKINFQQGGAPLANYFERNAGSTAEAALIMQVGPGR